MTAVHDSDAQTKRVVIVRGVNLMLDFDEIGTGVSDCTKTAISFLFLGFVVCNCIGQTRLRFSRRPTTHKQDTQIRVLLL